MKINKGKFLFQEYKSDLELENELSLSLTKKINLSIKKTGQASFALSGGKTPLSLYEKLSSKDIDWKKINLYLVDERLVDLNSSKSNQFNILNALSKKTSDFKEFRSFEYKRDAQGKIKLDNKEKKYDFPLNFILLGMGNDGHFGSIYPNLKNTKFLLDSNNKFYISHTRTNEEIPDRFTMTYKTISQSEMIIIYIKGRDKLSLIQKIVANDVSPNLYPVKTIFNEFENNLHLYWCE